ncbi:MAG: hypothetical protein PVF17_00335 [Ignavibacteria bacterium]|jgi:hypothetical protein
METYEGGLAQQSVKHYYGGASSTPKRSSSPMRKKRKCKIKNRKNNGK